MKCPNCGNEMVQSRAGWLCMSCGHIERPADTSSANIATGKDAHDQMRSAAAAANAPVADDTASGDDAAVATATIEPAADAAAPSSPVAGAPSSDDVPSAAVIPDESGAAPAPAVAAPWETPVADTASESNTVDTVVAADVAPSDPSTPSPADLSAVEKAVEDVQHTLGADQAADAGPKDEESDTDKTHDEDEDPRTDTDADEGPTEPDDHEELETATDPIKAPVEKTDMPDGEKELPASPAADDSHDEGDEADAADKQPDGPAAASAAETDDEPVEAVEPAASAASDVPSEEAPSIVSKHRVRIKPKVADEVGDKKKPDEDHAEPSASDSDDDSDKEPDSEEADADNTPKDAQVTPAADKDDEPEDDEATDDADDDKLEPVEDPKKATEATPSEKSDDEDGASQAVKPEEASSEAGPKDDEPDEDVAKADPGPGDEHNSEPATDSADDETDAVTEGSAADEKAVEQAGLRPPEPAEEEIDPEDTKPESLEQVEKDIEEDDEAKAEAAASGSQAEPASGSAAAQPDGGGAAVAAPVPIYDTAPASAASAAPDAANPDGDTLVAANAPNSSDAPAGAAAGPTQLNSVAPQTHPKPVRLGRLLAVVLGLAVIAVIAIVVYLFNFSAGGAMAGYLQKLASARTFTYAMTVSYVDGNNSLAFTSQGSADVSDKTSPKYNVRLTGQVSADSGALSAKSKAAAGALAGNMDLIGQTLYFSEASSKVLNQLLPLSLKDSTWYKYSLPSGAAQCMAPANMPFVGGALSASSPVTGASLVGVENLEGSRALHYKGTIDSAKLLAALQKANASVPSACRVNLAATSFQNMAITFDLWRASNRDRFVFYANNTKQGAHTEVTIDTANYNQALTISAPASATSVTTNGSGVLGASTARPAKAAAPDEATANAQRQAALRLYANAYAATRQNGFLYTVPVHVDVSAVDPSTGQPYVIQTTAPSAFGQIYYAAGHQCSGASIIPGKLATRRVALYMLMQGSSTPACLDVK